jgi:hypothetical protein
MRVVDQSWTTSRLIVPAEELYAFYQAVANEAGSVAIAEQPNSSTAFSIDLKCNHVGLNQTMESLLNYGPPENNRYVEGQGLLVFAQYVAAIVEKVYGSQQPFVVYAAKFFDVTAGCSSVVMRVHFPKILVTAERYEKLSRKIIDSLGYRFNKSRVPNWLFSQVVALGQRLLRYSPRENSWPSVLRDQELQQDNSAFRMVYSNFDATEARPNSECLFAPYAFFHNADDIGPDGALPYVRESSEQVLEHLMLATKRPLDAPDQRIGWKNQIGSPMLEEVRDDAGQKTGDFVTMWIFGGDP